MIRTAFAHGIAAGFVCLGLACGIAGMACATLAAWDHVQGIGVVAGASGVVSCFRAATYWGESH